MRILRIVLAVVAAILVVIPLLIFLAVWAASGFTSAAHWAAVYLLLWCIVLGLVPLAITFALAWKGLPFVHSKLAQGLETVVSIADRTSQFADRAGRKAAAPNIWLYSRAAWLRAFLGALWREFVPGQSRG